MSAPAGQNQHNADANAPSLNGAAPEADVLQVLSGFQASVENLKGLYAQRAAASAKLAERENELSAHAERLKALETELEARRAESERERASFEQLRAEAERRAQELSAKLAEAERVRESAEEHRAESEKARAQTEKSRVEAEALRAEADGLAEELRDRQAELDAARNAVEAQRRAVEASAAEVAAREASHRTKSAERDAAAGRVGEMDKQLKEMRAALAGEQARAKESEAALRRELEAAVKSRDEVAQRATQGSDLEERLRGELEAASRRSASLQAVVDEHAKQLAAQRDENKRLAGELASLASASSDQRSSSDADRTKLEKAAKALVELRAERDTLKGLISRLEDDLLRAAESQAHGIPSLPRDVVVEQRRRRVKRYRTLVKEQSEKVKKATDTLRSRFEAAEQLVSQRAELAEAHAAVKASERRTEKAKSKGRVAATMFYGLASALVMAFMCWVTTGWLTPGTYVATSIIGAESRTRALNEAELSEWQGFHEQLLADPQFHEVAAERLGRRGIVAYANPGAVRELVTQSVQTRSAEDGQLVIELRGEGADKTARILDTLTTALASHANSSRHKRVDSAVTTVKQASTPSDQPIDNQRLVYAALSWAVSLMLGFGVAAVLWRRMLHTKSRFERATRVDEILDETRWQPLPTAPTGRKGRSRIGF